MSAKVANNDWHNAAGRSKYRLWVLSFLVLMPEPLRGIEIRRIRGRRKHLDLPAVLRKELQDSGLLVKRRVVLD